MSDYYEPDSNGFYLANSLADYPYGVAIDGRRLMGEVHASRKRNGRFAALVRLRRRQSMLTATARWLLSEVDPEIKASG